ncbi:T9SS type A sorting domain-containing protein [Flavobacterium sp. FlaQc-48]|uniref:T9SS type A sorting domain-containing protein n=1 Tax=Flavobacterium sp. FlaQc-48 TaxID=3374181 RepID=UPI003758160F
MKTKLLLLLLLANFSIYAQQYTSIPDVNFENKLISLGIDSGNPDGKVLTANVAGVFYLYIDNSSITDLTGIEAFISLRELRCSSNRLTQLNLSKNNALIELECTNNLLTALDFSNNTALKRISCDKNKLANINVSKLLMLEGLVCGNNKITTLNVSSNVKMSQLICDNNLLESLDVTKNVQLTSFYCNSNKLTSLNIQNGKNYSITSISFRFNPDLKCIQVDNEADANTSWTDKKDLTASFSTDCAANTLIPDVNFENRLISLGLDSGAPDGKVLTANVASVTSLNVDNRFISDLTGIEAFTSLTDLSCKKNQITKIDLSRNKKLTRLDVSENQLTELNLNTNVLLQNLNGQINKITNLNLSANTNLSYLNVNSNQLSSLEISNNKLLSELTVTSNKLTNLNLDNNTTLTKLYCGENSLTSLNVSKNTLLTDLLCYSNQITALDVSTNTELTVLNAYNNKIAALNLSKNLFLKELDCGNNQLTSLDVSSNKRIFALRCNNNKLITLNLKNGNNNQLQTNISNFTLNPQLSCILVDDVNFANTNWSRTKDASASYSIDCAYTLIPDLNFENKLIALGIDSGAADGKVLTEKIKMVKSLTIDASTVSDLTGIEDFQALETLSCNANSYTGAGGNGKLKTINVSKNANLTSLSIAGNQISSLDISNNPKLATLAVNSNKISTLSTSANPALEYLSLSNNPISTLDISTNLALTYLYCGSTSLTTLNISKHTNLRELDIQNLKWTTLDISNNLNLVVLNCGYNRLASLDISKHTKLLYLYSGSNQLTSLDLSTNKNLSMLDVSSNRLTTLDLSKNTALSTIICNGNSEMTTLNLQNGRNTIISFIDLKNNPSLSCVLVDDVAYSNTKWTTSKDANVTYSLTCTAPEYVLIPDADFEKALISNGIDGVIDGKVLKSKVEATESLRFNGGLVTDLTGLEYFKNLKSLDCSGINYSTPSKLTKLDISALKNLTTLDCSYNNITTLNTSNNLVLENLKITKNKISKVDLTKNTALKTLDIRENAIAEINVTKNTALISIDASDANIKTLDVSNNTNLQYLAMKRNDLKILDLSKNTKLATLDLDSNDLRTLDLSKNTLLTNVSCSYNINLAYLNLKNGNNKNFKTNTFGYAGFVSTKLTCIEVDDVEYSNTNWAKFKDAAASYSNSCSVVAAYTAIPDSNFEDKLIALQIDQDGKNGKVLTASIINVTSLDISNSNIKDLTGIKDFNSLTSLNCSKNQLSELYLNNNTLLTNLNCSSNNIQPLDVSRNTMLLTLSASSNKLTNLDVSKNTNLIEFDCAGNNLYSLNVKNGNNANMQRMIFGNFTENPNLLCIQVDDVAFSTEKWLAKDAKATYSTAVCPENIQYTLIPDINFEKRLISLGIDSGAVDGKVLTSKIATVNYLYIPDAKEKITDLTGIADFTALETFYCFGQALTNIDLSTNLKLKYLNVSSNNLSTLDLSANTALEEIVCYSNKFTALDFSNNKALKNINASSNQLTTINVSKNTLLNTLVLYTNKIANIDLSNNIALTDVSINNNKLTAIELSKNLSLKTLNINSNTPLIGLNISKNTMLTYLDASGCQIKTLDVSNNKALITLEISGSGLETLDITKNPALTSLRVNSNELTSLNLQNGKNTFLVFNNLLFTSNPKLHCILVDDVNYANKNWLSLKDAHATYNTECTGELSLPANNFTVETKGESCLGENNGEISVVGKSSFAYAATINDKAYTFVNNSLKVASLTPGVYKIKITIPEMIFEQNFTVTIAKGATITGKSSITSRTVDVEITAGTAPFTVFVDGTEQFQTNDATFSVDVAKSSLVEVATAKACEGIFAKKVSVSDFDADYQILSAYPNPTSGSFEIEIPGIKNEVTIELYNFSGQLVSAKTYPVESGKAQLNLENQPSGIYAAKVYLDAPEYIKIIKK